MRLCMRVWSYQRSRSLKFWLKPCKRTWLGCSLRSKITRLKLQETVKSYRTSLSKSLMKILESNGQGKVALKLKCTKRERPKLVPTLRSTSGMWGLSSKNTICLKSHGYSCLILLNKSLGLIKKRTANLRHSYQPEKILLCFRVWQDVKKIHSRSLKKSVSSSRIKCLT